MPQQQQPETTQQQQQTNHTTIILYSFYGNGLELTSISLPVHVHC